MSSGGRDYPTGARIPGTVYQVVRRIGGGGMGTVYDVEDVTIGKRYVLKALLPQLCAREDLARRMQNEARTLARLNHPNIVEVITAGVTQDDLRLPYYVMERLTGQSLRLVLDKRGQLDLAHAYHIAIDLLDALDHAHDKGVIHRDVKPDNIFLHRTTAGVTVTKLLDFGIVSLLDSGPRETAGRFLGTLRYAAPEQLRGDSPSAQIDIYCAALVFYEMLAGRGPFDDQGDSAQIAAAHLHQTPPPLSRFTAVPPELDGLMAAALSKEPEARPRDAFSFASSLRNLKRALVTEPARESTESRATAPSVVSARPAGLPLVEVRRASSDGGYVVSPLPAAPPASKDGLARTTIRGMPVPTLGPEAEPLSPLASTVPHDPSTVDRKAPTHSQVAHAPGIGVPPAKAAEGTEGMLVEPPLGVTVRAHPLPLPDAGASAMSPSERPRSERPVVSNDAWPEGGPPSFGGRSTRGFWALTTAAAIGLLVAAGLLAFTRHPLSPRAASAQTLPTPAVQEPAPTDPSSVPPRPAPPLPLSEALSASALPVASVAPPAPVAKPAGSKPRTDRSASALERPGPGF